MSNKGNMNIDKMKDDIAYLRKSQELRDKQQEKGMSICRGCATQIIILLIGIPILLALFTK